MSELLVRPVELVASSETVEVPSREEQAVFFEEVFDEIDSRRDPTLHKKGPMLGEFLPVFEWITGQLKDVDPTLKPDALFPVSYRSQETVEALRGRHSIESKLSVIGDERLKLLSGLASGRLTPRLSTQILPEGVVDAPPYAPQKNTLGCSLACYRMLFEAVAGWQPDENVLVERLVATFKAVLVDDSVFHKTFETEAFEDLTSKKITMIDIVGADLTSLTTLAAKMRARSDVDSVYCMVNLASIDDKYRTTKSWHKVALLAADGNRVTYHDPKPDFGENFSSSYEMFASRWAPTYNRAQLAVVRDLSAKES